MPLRECAACEGTGLASAALTPRGAGCGFCGGCGVYVGTLCALPPATARAGPACPRCRQALRSDNPWIFALVLGTALAVLAVALGAVALAEAHRSATMASSPEVALGDLPAAGSLVKVAGILASGRSPAAFLRAEGNGPLAREAWIVFGFAIQEGARSVPVDVSGLHKSIWGKVVRSEREDGSYRPGDRVALAATVMATSVGTALHAERLAPDLDALVRLDADPAIAAGVTGAMALVMLLPALMTRASRLGSHSSRAKRFREEVWPAIAARRGLKRKEPLARGIDRPSRWRP